MGIFSVLRKAKCRECGVVKPNCLPEFSDSSGKVIDLCTECAGDLLVWLLGLKERVQASPDTLQQPTRAPEG